MITYFKYDEMFTFIGEVVKDTIYEPFPVASTNVQVPDLADGEFAVFNGNDWVIVTERPEKPVKVPHVVTNAQARLALLQSDSLSSAQAALDGMSEPDRTAALIEWEHRPTVERNSALVLSLAETLGLTDAEIDSLFILADTL